MEHPGELPLPEGLTIIVITEKHSTPILAAHHRHDCATIDRVICWDPESTPAMPRFSGSRRVIP